MKIKTSLVALFAIATIAGANNASAIEIEMGVWQSGSVGNFRANPVGDFESVLDNYALGKSTDGTWFGTFCIEKNEYFTPGSTYDVTFNNGAVSGGKTGATNGKDIISKGTAWLYKQYAIGTLSGLNYASQTALSNLQNAIWYLEGEIQIGSNPASGYASLIDLAKSSLGLDLAGIKTDYSGSEVRVMNLTSNNGANQHQDQLVFQKVPDTGSTLALFGISFVGFLTFRRRSGK